MKSEEVDAIWAQHVGSRRLTPKAELTQLRKLTNNLSWEIVMCLFYSSKVWNAIRWKVICRDGSCVKCGSELHLNVDHIRYPNKLGNEKLSDLQLLCWSCHKEKTIAYDLGANGFGERLKVDVAEDAPLYAVKGVRNG
jgi:5-methylcytosine-specific restriction endonuclease McrA